MSDNDDIFISKELMCLKCHGVLKNPYECKQCRKSFCYDCIKNDKKCFYCGISPPNFKENITFNRIIINDGVKPVCENCQMVFNDEKDLKFHKCKAKIFKCKICSNFESKENEKFWEHIKNNHKNELLKEFASEIDK